MRRALALLLSLSIAAFGAGAYLDSLQHRTALRYLRQLDQVRALANRHAYDDAAREQAYMHALWQHDERWLKCVVSHHHVRAVNEAMVKLSTALLNRWQDEALLALDETFSALNDLQTSHLPTLSNVL